MASDVEIVVKATDQASAKIAAVNKTLGETQSGTGAVKMSMTELSSAIGLAEKAFSLVQGAMAQTVGVAVSYADEVRKLTQLTGESAEESSRVIQVMDDYKVSTEALTMAQRTLSKDGLSLNIDTLAKLSDEYNTLGSGAEKTRFLLEKFGRSGLQMAEAMEQGGAAIRGASDALSGNLVLTQKQVDAARNYQKQLDSLNDTVDAFKVGLGNEALPAINTGLSNFNKAAEESGLIVAALSFGFDDLYTALATQPETVDSATQSYTAMAAALQGEVVPALTETDDAAKELDKSFKAQLSIMGSLQSADESYASKSKDLTAQRIQLEKDRAQAISQGWWESSQKIQDLDAKLAANSEAARANADEHELATKRIILGYTEQLLAADGLNADEMQYLIDKGVEWGIYSATVASEAQKIIEEANAINSAIQGITSRKDIQIFINTFGSAGGGGGTGGGGTGGGKYEYRDFGGRGYAGQTYVINPKAGPELFTPDTNGTFTPNAGAGGEYNAALMATMAALPDQIARAVATAFAKVGR